MDPRKLISLVKTKRFVDKPTKDTLRSIVVLLLFFFFDFILRPYEKSKRNLKIESWFRSSFQLQLESKTCFQFLLESWFRN